MVGFWVARLVPKQCCAGHRLHGFRRRNPCHPTPTSSAWAEYEFRDGASGRGGRLVRGTGGAVVVKKGADVRMRQTFLTFLTSRWSDDGAWLEVVGQRQVPRAVGGGAARSKNRCK